MFEEYFMENQEEYIIFERNLIEVEKFFEELSKVNSFYKIIDAIDFKLYEKCYIQQKYLLCLSDYFRHSNPDRNHYFFTPTNSLDLKKEGYLKLSQSERIYDYEKGPIFYIPFFVLEEKKDKKKVINTIFSINYLEKYLKNIFRSLF